MKKNGFISRTMTVLLLTVTMYMYVCSGLCAVGSGACCTAPRAKSTSQKSCCEHPQKGEHQSKSCKDLHSAFFSTTGQFAPAQHYSINTELQVIAILPPPIVNILLQYQQSVAIAYVDNDPPLPETDIRLMIRSFQI